MIFRFRTGDLKSFAGQTVRSCQFNEEEAASNYIPFEPL